MAAAPHPVYDEQQLDALARIYAELALERLLAEAERQAAEPTQKDEQLESTI